jgi:hypothetical protein
MKQLITQLKENNQDFEFYPSTRQIIEVINKDLRIVSQERGIRNTVSLLDIGAGNGNVFNILEELNPEIDNKGYKERQLWITKFAIEKSEILINQMSSDIFVIGTNFYQQSLIDKKVDVIFCNPPYKEYVQWTSKIITEANSKFIYLVIPERWKENKALLDIIKKRKVKYEILGSFDFLEADRPARAKVDIVKIINYKDYYGSNHRLSDPFDVWFDEFFHINSEPEETSDYEKNKIKIEEIKNNVIKGQNLIERLDVLYKKDFEKLLNNYKAIEQLDYEVLKELNVNVDALKEGLKLKIQGLKNLYWKELFDNLNTITNRLTKSSREKLLNKLNEHITVDFSVENAYAIVLWAIKNANVYFDEQLKEVYLWMSGSENVQNYKSNKKFIEDGWRFNCELREGKYTHYALDYRLVFKGYNNFGGYEYDHPKGLNISTHEKINDIITIAKNLGFTVNESTMNYLWKPGKENIFTFGNDSEEFMRIRAYINGNIHCKFNQKFMKKLNIEAGRLNGWIKSPIEAAEEMNIDLLEVEELYNTNMQIPLKDVKLLI